MTSHLLLYVGLFNNFKLKNAACSQYNLYPAGPPRQPSDRVARRPILNFILKHLVQFLILSLLVDLKQFCRSTKSMGVLRTWSKLYPGSTPGSTFIQSIRQFSASVVFLTQLLITSFNFKMRGKSITLQSKTQPEGKKRPSHGPIFWLCTDNLDWTAKHITAKITVLQTDLFGAYLLLGFRAFSSESFSSTEETGW